MGICEQDTLYLGENELFFSDHVDNVYIDSIIGKCYVFTINDYDNCPTIDDNTYFSRSVFNTREQSLNPPFNEWETFCNCKKPMNPNLLTVGCDKWGKWYHPKCEGLADESIPAIETFICRECKTKSL